MQTKTCGVGGPPLIITFWKASKSTTSHRYQRVASFNQLNPLVDSVDRTIIQMTLNAWPY